MMPLSVAAEFLGWLQSSIIMIKNERSNKERSEETLIAFFLIIKLTAQWDLFSTSAEQVWISLIWDGWVKSDALHQEPSKVVLLSNKMICVAYIIVWKWDGILELLLHSFPVAKLDRICTIVGVYYCALLSRAQHYSDFNFRQNALLLECHLLCVCVPFYTCINLWKVSLLILKLGRSRTSTLLAKLSMRFYRTLPS